MIENKYYFSIVKFCCIIMLIIYFVINSQKSLHAISLEWFLLAVTLAFSIGYELENNEKKEFHLNTWSNIKKWLFQSKIKLFFLIGEIVLTLILILFFRDSNNGLFLIPLVVMDTIIFLRISFAFSLISCLGIFLSLDYFFIYLIYGIFITIIYFQNFFVIERYKKYMEDFERKENQLKDSISSRDSIYKEQLDKSSLAFENRMLEEKSRLSQALHDKLGHSINGSIYQLEACKVLMDNNPEESRKIMQAVINNLRTSMNEIRMILRREKPDKKPRAYLQMKQLCSDCKDKYNIDAEFEIKGEDKTIPEPLWEVILDNTLEAVTNSLKYAHCTKISIEIIILHKVIRCSIKDNGIGCDTIKEGMGLQGIKNRTRKANGFVDISCKEGFHINMIFPLDHQGVKEIMDIK